jgi:hypothetical protein
VKSGEVEWIKGLCGRMVGGVAAGADCGFMVAPFWVFSFKPVSAIVAVPSARIITIARTHIFLIYLLLQLQLVGNADRTKSIVLI